MKGVWIWGKREIIYLSLHCHHQNDSCIKTGSDESHFNVSLNVRDKVTRQCPQTTTFEENREPRLIRTEVPLLNSLALGQPGSLQCSIQMHSCLSHSRQGKNPELTQEEHRKVRVAEF